MERLIASRWDAEYKSGIWAYLHNHSESIRYSVLSNFISRLGRSISVLDLGCGEGILLKFLDLHSIRQYVGVDVSEVALGRIAQRRKQDTFILSSIEEHTIDNQYDVIVFNEVLYYLKNPLSQIRRFSQCLNRGGIMLISLHMDGFYFSSKRALARSLVTYLRNNGYSFEELELKHISSDVTWRLYCISSA